MRRLALLFALGLLVLLPGSANAAVRQHTNQSCTTIWNNLGNPVPFVCLAEDTNFGGDKLTLTGSSDIINLDNTHHDLSALCGPKIYPSVDNWNDCISSVWVKLGNEDSVCLYSNENFVTMQWRAGRPPVSPPGTVWTYSHADVTGYAPRDIISSVMLQQSGNQCGEVGV